MTDMVKLIGGMLFVSFAVTGIMYFFAWLITL